MQAGSDVQLAFLPRLTLVCLALAPDPYPSPSRGRVDILAGQTERLRRPHAGITEQPDQDGVAVAAKGHRDFFQSADSASVQRLDVAGGELASFESRRLAILASNPLEGLVGAAPVRGQARRPKLSTLPAMLLKIVTPTIQGPLFQVLGLGDPVLKAPWREDMAQRVPILILDGRPLDAAAAAGHEIFLDCPCEVRRCLRFRWPSRWLSRHCFSAF